MRNASWPDDERGDRVLADLDGVARANEAAHNRRLAVDADVALARTHALLCRALRERDAKRRMHADAGGEGEQRAAALNVHAGKSTLAKPSRSPLSCPIVSRRKPARIFSSTRTTRSTGIRGARRRSRARRDEDKPILLSVGYSACHWCHVMAHESFEDPAVAGADERASSSTSRSTARSGPTSTRSTSSRTQMLAQRTGGWPLTMFLTPEGTPFFGGTYFPKDARYDLPGFPRLLERIAQVYARAPRRDRASRTKRCSRPSRACSPARRRTTRSCGRADRGGAAQPQDQFRLALRRLRRRAQVSASRRARVLPAALGRDGRRRGRARRDVHAGAHGARRHLRPAGRRLRALQRRRASGRFRTSRRCSTTTGRSCACYADAWTVTRESAVRARRRGDRGLGDARDAVARGRLLLLARRRLRARGRQVLRLDARRGALAAHARRSTRSLAPHYGLDGPPNFENSALASARGPRRSPADGSTAPRFRAQEALRGAREARASRARREGAGLAGTRS